MSYLDAWIDGGSADSLNTTSSVPVDVSQAPAPTVGQVLTATSPIAAVWATPVVPVTQSWHTLVYIPDFAALPNQPITENGVHTISGYAFTVENIGNLGDGQTMGVVNGAGLQLDASISFGDANAFLFGRLTPSIRFDLPALVANGVPVRCAAKFGLITSGYAPQSVRTNLAVEYPVLLPTHWHRTVEYDAFLDLSPHRIILAAGNSLGQGEEVTLSGWDNAITVWGQQWPEGIGPTKTRQAMVGTSLADLGALCQIQRDNTVSALNETWVPASAAELGTLGQAMNWAVTLAANTGSGAYADDYVYIAGLKIEAYY